MKLSELIEQAAQALLEHGDVPVVSYERGCGCCSQGTGVAVTGISSDVWVYNFNDASQTVPLVFVVEG